MASSVNLDSAEELNITCRRGDTFTLTIVLKNSSGTALTLDRKSTRLNSSHGYISYAVFCLKKKNTKTTTTKKKHKQKIQNSINIQMNKGNTDHK